MSDATPETPPKKNRSIVERVLVQGGILLLLAVAVLQYMMYRGYANTTKLLQSEVQKSDDSNYVVTDKMVQEMIQGEPRFVQGEAGANRVDTYTWKGLLKNYVLNVHYSVNPPEVIKIEAE